LRPITSTSIAVLLVVVVKVVVVVVVVVVVFAVAVAVFAVVVVPLVFKVTNKEGKLSIIKIHTDTFHLSASYMFLEDIEPGQVIMKTSKCKDKAEI
jgi:hypothetical protein